MKATFNLRDLVISVLREWRWMLTFAIIFTVLLGGYKYYSGMSSLNNPDYVVNDNVDFEQKKTNLEGEIKTLGNSIDMWEEFYLNSAFMNLDPYNTEVHHVSFMVQLNEENDNNDLLSNDIATAYAELISNGGIYEQISIDEKEKEECSYLISAKATGSIVSISAVMDAQGIAEKAVGQIIDGIEQKTILLSVVAKGYHIDLISDNTCKANNLEEESLASKQSMIVVYGDRYQTSLDTKKKLLSTLESENGYEEITTSSVIKDAIKFGIVGFVSGIIVGVIIGFFLDLMGSRLRDAKEIENELEIQSIGNPYYGVSTKKRNPIDRLVDHIEGKEYISCSMREKGSYIASNLEVLLHGKDQMRNILVTGCAAEDRMNELCGAIHSELSDDTIVVTFGEDITKSTSTVRKANQCDAVILVEEIGVSKWNEVVLTKDVINNLKKEILGYILI